MRLQGLPPIVSPATRLLVLGSFPGARSLALQQYYGHPQNHFWRILGALWSIDLQGMDYAQRAQVLHAHGLGLWDVYASCEREGSLDTAIRNAEVNDFSALARDCPALVAVAHNGGESFRHTRHVAAALGPRAAGVAFYKLPSTSPANASWSFERKRAAWAEVLQTLA
ncbi:MAG TPA: DNA-deoxyinosine glycosylase [Burkholderiaceae bacterium]